MWLARSAACVVVASTSCCLAAAHSSASFRASPATDLDRGRIRLIAIAGGNASKVRGVAGLLNGHAVTAADLALITDHLDPAAGADVHVVEHALLAALRGASDCAARGSTDDRIARLLARGLASRRRQAEGAADHGALRYRARLAGRPRANQRRFHIEWSRSARPSAPTPEPRPRRPAPLLRRQWTPCPSCLFPPLVVDSPGSWPRFCRLPICRVHVIVSAVRLGPVILRARFRPAGGIDSRRAEISTPHRKVTSCAATTI